MHARWIVLVALLLCPVSVHAQEKDVPQIFIDMAVVDMGMSEWDGPGIVRDDDWPDLMGKNWPSGQHGGTSAFLSLLPSTRVLATPHIITEDGEQTQLTVSVMEEIGESLTVSVLPTLEDDGTVAMEVELTWTEHGAEHNATCQSYAAMRVSSEATVVVAPRQACPMLWVFTPYIVRGDEDIRDILKGKQAIRKALKRLSGGS